MKPITFILLSVSLSSLSSYGQSLAMSGDLRFTVDSTTKSQLTSALNGFLDQKEKPNKENTFVLKSDLLATSLLLDELKGMEKNAKLKDDHFYKPYLQDITDISNSEFLVQLSYIGMAENTPVLRASFKLIAEKQGDRFYFCSPLKRNTVSWKTKRSNNITFYFKDTLDAASAKSYAKAIDLYDKKLKAPASPIAFYFCDDLPEALQIPGIDYKADYIGKRYDDLSSQEDNQYLELNGGYNAERRFDPHDLWHARLRMVMDAGVINRPVDEGCAYLYGGSWGQSWEFVLSSFKQYAAENPTADWLQLYIDSKNLKDKEKPIKVPYAINALIIRKIEKEKGFAPVMELLACGKRETGDANYFKALEKVSGIRRADFNTAVWSLIKE